MQVTQRTTAPKNVSGSITLGGVMKPLITSLAIACGGLLHRIGLNLFRLLCKLSSLPNYFKVPKVEKKGGALVVVQEV